MEQEVQNTQPVESKTNGCAIAGFVLSLLGLTLIPFVLCIIGLIKSKETNSGKGLSIAGLVIIVLKIVLVVICATLFSTLIFGTIKENINRSVQCEEAYLCRDCKNGVCTCTYQDDDGNESDITCPMEESYSEPMTTKRIDLDSEELLLEELCEKLNEKYITTPAPQSVITSCGIDFEDYKLTNDKKDLEEKYSYYFKISNLDLFPESRGKYEADIKEFIQLKEKDGKTSITYDFTNHGEGVYTIEVDFKINKLEYVDSHHGSYWISTFFYTNEGIYHYFAQDYKNEDNKIEKITDDKDAQILVDYLPSTSGNNAAYYLKNKNGDIYYIDTNDFKYKLTNVKFTNPETVYFTNNDGMIIRKDRTVEINGVKQQYTVDEIVFDTEGGVDGFIDNNGYLHYQDDFKANSNVRVWKHPKSPVKKVGEYVMRPTYLLEDNTIHVVYE